MQKVAVIGAGVSGLSVARFLEDRYQVRIFEKEHTPGGLIRCKRIDGSLFHTCGGHVFNSKRQDVLDWFWNIFSREDAFAKTERNSVVFMDNGMEIPYPIENHMYLFDGETQKKYIADMLQITQGVNQKPQNFEEFLQHRFGMTLYDMYFKPYNEKVWRNNLKSVPLSWLEGKLPMPTVEEMLYNNMNHIKEKAFVHSSFWYERKNGSQFIADSLAQGLDICYGRNIDVISFMSNEKSWLIDGERFDKVVFCGNIKEMVKMLDGVDIESYKTEIEDLGYHGTTAVFCEIDANPYSWIYLPNKEYESHRIICTGNFANSNNSASLSDNRITATVEFTDEISKDLIVENLDKMPLNPHYINHVYNKYTYPIQSNSTRNMIKELKSKLAANGFYFTGRFADWEYYNMDVCMGAAMDLCKTI